MEQYDAELIDHTVIDRLHRTGGDELVGKMLELFATYVADRVQDARHAVDEGRLADVAKAAHAIRSSAGNIGATVLFDIATRIEHNVENAAPQEAPSMVGELEHTFAATLRGVEQLEWSRDETNSGG